MLQGYKEFKIHHDNKNIKMIKSKFDNTIQRFTILQILQTDKCDQRILQEINQSKFIIVDVYSILNNQYIIICFDKYLIIFEISNFEIFQTVLSDKNKEKIFIHPKAANFFLNNDQIDLSDKVREINTYFIEEIQNFLDNFQIRSNDKSIILFWKIIQPSLAAFLIQQNYFETKNDRVKDFIENFEKEKDRKQTKIYKDDDFIYLRTIGNSFSSDVQLFYHIESEKIFAVKKFVFDKQKLEEREINNYESISYPFIPKFYGLIQRNNKQHSIVIEFINGKALNCETIIEMSIEDKIKIILEILYTFQYLHNINYIYRDFKDDNIIIDQNQHIVLIDFDRMIKKDNEFENNKDFTKDLNSFFVDPLIKENECIPSFQNDVYSIGIMIYYIFAGNLPAENKSSKNCDEKVEEFKMKYSNIYNIYDECINNDPEKRPSLNVLIDCFRNYDINVDRNILKNKISLIRCANYLVLAENFNCKNAQYLMGIYYYDGKLIKQDIKKSIQYFERSANLKNPKASNKLGYIYLDDKYVKRDINKSLFYFTLSAELNNAEAQNIIGVFYFEGKYVKKDINKAIHYLLLAADQNNANSQNIIGFIYYEGIYAKRDINKALHYLSLAVKQNHIDALNNLGNIYLYGIFVKQNINKAIYYLTQAAKQNYSYAQNNLGMIYSDARYNVYDVDKAIYYYELSAKQNNILAQRNLASLYISDNNKKDIEKAIYYYTLAADLNDQISQYKLGLIFYEGKYIKKDLKKAIYYLSLSAAQNCINSLYLLGVIFSDENYSGYDINKSIYYFTIVANQANSKKNELNDIYLYNKGYSTNFNDFKNHLSDENLIIANSLYKLGNIYIENNIMTHDIKKAIYYYTQAANKKHPLALNELGLLYYEGIYISRDINKAIYYLSLAANQNNPISQYTLGVIYYIGKYIERDINKSILFWTASAKQNYSDAQLSLGSIYCEGKYVKRDINKAIQYYTRAAKNNNSTAQNNLGYLYMEGLYVTRDINKAIYYLSLAASQNDSDAQGNLGYMYYEGKYIKRDINKAMYYFKLAANQNNPITLFNLAHVYFDNKYIKRDMDKVIYYLELAAKQNYVSAYAGLGIAYYKGAYIKQNVNKGICYLSFAADQNNAEAQFYLGYIHYNGEYNDHDMERALKYLKLASDNGFIRAQLLLGDLYFEGKFVERDIKMALKLYKEVSSFKNQYAKNNLGVIYKNGFNEINPNNENAKIYFIEAIKEKNDYLAMHNLALIYLEEEEDSKNLEHNESIKILIKSSSQKFLPSEILLCLVILMKYNSIFLETVENELKKYGINSNDLAETIYIDFSKFLWNRINLLQYSFIENSYKLYSETYFVYINGEYMPLNELNEIKYHNFNEKFKQKNIDDHFYDGFK